MPDVRPHLSDVDRDQLAAECAAQGVPLTVTNPAILAGVARIISAPSGATVPGALSPRRRVADRAPV